jgi:hypothetical protein
VDLIFRETHSSLQPSLSGRVEHIFAAHYDLGTMAPRDETLDVEARRVEKDAQRDVDERSVALGLKSSEQLRRENESFALALASVASFDLEAMRRPLRSCLTDPRRSHSN